MVVRLRALLWERKVKTLPVTSIILGKESLYGLWLALRPRLHVLLTSQKTSNRVRLCNDYVSILFPYCKENQFPGKLRHASFIIWLRLTFHEPNLIPWIKCMKSSASESVKNGYLNLKRLSRSFRVAQSGISPLERLWFRRRTFHVPT